MKNSSLSRKKSGFPLVDGKSEGTKHRTEWCAEADRYRCMRCGRGSKCMKLPGRCTGPKFLSKSLGKWRRRHLGGHDLVRRMDRQGEVLTWCRKCSGYARPNMGTKLINCSRPEQMGTKEFGNIARIRHQIRSVGHEFVDPARQGCSTHVPLRALKSEVLEGYM